MTRHLRGSMVDDVVSELLLRSWQLNRPMTSLEVRHYVYDHLRHERVILKAQENAARLRAEKTSSPTYDDSLDKLMAAASLSDTDKYLIFCIFWQNKTIKAIADYYQVGPQQVLSRLQRALAELRSAALRYGADS